MGDEDSEVAHPVQIVEDGARSPRQIPSAPRRSGSVALIAALIALILAGFAAWRVIVLEHGQGDAQSAMRSALDARINELARTTDQQKHDLDGLRARLADADTVDKGIREEMLALGERSRHLEDAVANLAEQRLTGRDALALNEAEFLLQLAQERLDLFHDAQAALTAYRLADSALASAEDPVFAGVRQTIGAEMQALQAAKPLETGATLAALDRVRSSLATLPARPVHAPTPAASSRFEALVQQFVHISSDDAAAPASRDLELARSLAAIDLHAAQAALLARDPAAYTAAIARTRAALGSAFDAQAAPVKDELAELERLGATPLAPALPELGSALRELRNLRATRALAVPRAAAQAGAGAGT